MKDDTKLGDHKGNGLSSNPIIRKRSLSRVERLAQVTIWFCFLYFFVSLYFICKYVIEFVREISFL